MFAMLPVVLGMYLGQVLRDRTAPETSQKLDQGSGDPSSCKPASAMAARYRARSSGVW
jgi:hypothetical protein